MQRHTKETGAALLLLIGITAALAILTAALVVLLANQQGATAAERQTKTSLYYAEAALDSGVNAIKTTTTVSTVDFPTGPSPQAQIDMTQMNTEYVVACPSPAPTPIYKVYDNVSGADVNVAYDANGDHRVWVQATVNYLGRTTRLRLMLDSDTKASILPEAALYADVDIVASGTSDIYAVKSDWSFYTAGLPPYVTSIMAGDDFTGNASTNLSPPGQSPAKQTLGINVNGSVSLSAITENGVTIGGVGLLSDYFDQFRQYTLSVEARTGINAYDSVTNPTGTDKGFANPAGTAVAASQFTPANLTTAYLTSLNNSTFNAGTKTYTFNTDLVVSGNLTLSSSTFPSGTMFNFKSLYVIGGLTLTGDVTVNTAALYVGGNFAISGTTTNIVDQFGPIYVTGTADWNGGSSSSRLTIKTTQITSTLPQYTQWADSTTPGPMYALLINVDGDTNGNYQSGTGPYDLVLGDVWIDGNAGTGNVAVNISAPSSGTNSTVMCPLLATTEKTATNGRVNFGTLTDPMVYFMQCDNDGLYSNTCYWASSGVFTGLMVIMEADIVISGGNDGTLQHSNIVGSVMADAPIWYNNNQPQSADITLSGNSSVCYNQAAIDNLPPTLQSILRTKTTTAVPGTWQQLQAN